MCAAKTSEQEPLQPTRLFRLDASSKRSLLRRLPNLHSTPELGKWELSGNHDKSGTCASAVAENLFGPSGWEVPGIKSAERFFSALTEVLPLPVHLCFEGTSISSDVRTLLASSAVAAALPISPGTIWPKPSVFHVLATEQFIYELAALAGRHAEPEVCDHFHAYNNGQGLMQWYDAFDLPLLVDESITEASLQVFCRKLGVQYARWHAA